STGSVRRSTSSTRLRGGSGGRLLDEVARVGAQREEGGVLLLQRNRAEQVDRIIEPVTVATRQVEVGDDPLDDLTGDGGALLGDGVLVDPLPDLRPADLRRRGILHEV